MKSIIILSLTCILINMNAQTAKSSVADWSKNAVIYEVNTRQYSKEGTFNKVTEDLDRIKNLGIDIIWLMPIQPIGELNRKGTLGSYYAIKDYKAVNPEFGTMDDFKTLVKTAHQKGIKVIIDWVANHSSPDNVWIKTDFDFYTKDSLGNAPIPTIGTDWTDVADLNYDNPKLRMAMQDAMKYWVTATDIDGFRCDVAELVPLDFWVDTRVQLDKIKPMFMLAEGSKPELFEAFDMVYGWELTDLMIESNSGKKSIQDIVKYRENYLETYQPKDIVMYFTTNHDKNSWDFLESDVFGKNRLNYAALTALMNGMPLVYNGQESGLDKKIAFFEKDPIDWSNYQYTPFYQSLFKIYKSNPALWNGVSQGQFQALESPNPKVLIFTVSTDTKRVLVIQNYSDQKVVLNATDYFDVEDDLTNRLSGKPIKLKNEQMTLEPHSTLIFSN